MVLTTYDSDPAHPLQGLSPSAAYNPACKQAVSSLQTVTGMQQQGISHAQIPVGAIYDTIEYLQYKTDMLALNMSRSLYRYDVSPLLMIPTLISVVAKAPSSCIIQTENSSQQQVYRHLLCWNINPNTYLI